MCVPWSVPEGAACDVMFQRAWLWCWELLGVSWTSPCFGHRRCLTKSQGLAKYCLKVARNPKERKIPKEKMHFGMTWFIAAITPPPDGFSNRA